MPPTPIYTADSLIQTALYSAITTAVPSVKCYWLVAPANTQPPYIILQLQSDINTAHMIGRGGATGLVTVKAIADTLNGARSLLASVSPAVAAANVAGYTTSIRYERSPISPYDGIAYQAMHVFRFTLIQPLS